MDKYHLHWFTDEINMHVLSAIASYQHLLGLIGNRETRQSRDVWFVLLSFLSHAALVSKIFDPIRPDDAKKTRASALKDHLNITEDSPILTRSARDNLEHIDERIDRWVQSGNTKVLEMVFEDRKSFEYIYGNDGAIRRVLIVDEMVFMSEGRGGEIIETKLNPVFSSLKDLSNRCNEKLRNESPYNYVLAQALLNYEC